LPWGGGWVAGGGGHDRRAGGLIPLASVSENAIENIQSELRKRLLKVMHIEECRGQRLVSKRDILQNLHT
jgi:translation initiation factor 2 alpha subunit (eIF-2alpha)